MNKINPFKSKEEFKTRWIKHWKSDIIESGTLEIDFLHTKKEIMRMFSNDAFKKLSKTLKFFNTFKEPFFIFRVIYVENVEKFVNNIQNKNIDHIGKYWSYNFKSADTYQGDPFKKHKKVRIIAVTPFKNVNWKQTIILNIPPFEGMSISWEKEIRMYSNRLTMIKEIHAITTMQKLLKKYTINNIKIKT